MRAKTGLEIEKLVTRVLGHDSWYMTAEELID
jgi:hypothetical protein